MLKNQEIIIPSFDDLSKSEHDLTSFEFDLEGLSNTPPSTPNNVPNNVCIDYLKMRLDSMFSPESPTFKNLLDALRVSPKVYDQDIKIKNYDKTYVFDANVFISTGGDTTKNKEGGFTTIVELKGQACREFEGRGGSWTQLFQEFMKLNATCKRIDLALDDFNNTCPVKSLIYKVNKSLYCSDWKNRPEVRFSANGGFSMTFGKMSSKTLCIYNKSAERQQKGIDVFCKDWLRYEARYKDDTANDAFLETYCGLTSDELDIVCKKLIRGLIEFKKDTSEDRNHLYRVDCWDKWDKLLDVDSRIKIRNQYKLETTITTKINWLGRSATKNRILMELVNPGAFDKVDGYFVYDHIGKLRNRDIASLNYLRKNFGYEVIDLDTAVSYLNDKYSIYSNPDSDVCEMIGLVNHNGEFND